LGSLTTIDKTLDIVSTLDKSQMHEYSYNWPYDFFSLVELVKVDAKIDMGPPL
jgi:hypothetical protein